MARFPTQCKIKVKPIRGVRTMQAAAKENLVLIEVSTRIIALEAKDVVRPNIDLDDSFTHRSPAAKVNLETENIPNPKGETPPELAEEASKGLENDIK